jgi:hypothetical protein
MASRRGRPGKADRRGWGRAAAHSDVSHRAAAVVPGHHPVMLAHSPSHPGAALSHRPNRPAGACAALVGGESRRGGRRGPAAVAGLVGCGRPRPPPNQPPTARSTHRRHSARAASASTSCGSSPIDGMHPIPAAGWFDGSTLLADAMMGCHVSPSPGEVRLSRGRTPHDGRHVGQHHHAVPRRAAATTPSQARSTSSQLLG